MEGRLHEGVGGTGAQHLDQGAHCAIVSVEAVEGILRSSLNVRVTGQELRVVDCCGVSSHSPCQLRARYRKLSYACGKLSTAIGSCSRSLWQHRSSSLFIYYWLITAYVRCQMFCL